MKTFRRMVALLLVTLGLALFSPAMMHDARADDPGGPANGGEYCGGGGGCVAGFTCDSDTDTCIADGGATTGGVTPMAEVLCDIINWFIYGNLGKGLAILAVGMLGIGAALGKTSWGTAITVGAGIAIMFGAFEVVSAMGIPVTYCPVSASTSSGSSGSSCGGEGGSCVKPDGSTGECTASGCV